MISEIIKKGHLLIAEPSILGDLSFNRSVILLADHNAEGSVGFILNKPLDYSVNDLVPEVDATFTIYNGGPVEQDNLYFIHNIPELIPNSVEISNGVFWGGDFEKTRDLINNGSINKDNIRFFLGYTGWDANQLETEMSANSWILIEKLSRIISGILVGILVARYLGPEQFGMISYALNVVAIFTVFSSLGMDSIIVRELITRNIDKNKILGTSFCLRLIGSIAVVAVATFYSSIRDDTQNTYIVFLVSLSVMLQAFTVVDFYFQSQVLGKYTAINQVITLILSSIVKLLLIYFNKPVEYFASMVVLEATLTLINQFWFYRKNGQHLSQWQFSWKEAGILLGHSWPIIVSGFVMMVYQKMDQILIKRFLDLNALGNYAAAIRISEESNFIPVAFCAAILPGIINNRDNRELQFKRFTQLCSLLIWSAIFISLGVQVFGDWVIHFFYKEKYPLSADVFKIHIWATIPTFYGTALGLWFLAENKQRVIILYQVVNIFAYTVMCCILIPRNGGSN
jgi:O-antigen/teichoic acid export membrane protein